MTNKKLSTTKRKDWIHIRCETDTKWKFKELVSKGHFENGEEAIKYYIDKFETIRTKSEFEKGRII